MKDGSKTRSSRSGKPNKKEIQKRIAEERRAAYLAEQEAQKDPDEKFRYEDGSMPEGMAERYRKTEETAYRIPYILICVAFLLFYGYAAIAGHLSIAKEPAFHWAAAFFLISGLEELVFGIGENAIKTAKLAALDRKLADWRRQNEQ